MKQHFCTLKTLQRRLFFPDRKPIGMLSMMDVEATSFRFLRESLAKILWSASADVVPQANRGCRKRFERTAPVWCTKLVEALVCIHRTASRFCCQTRCDTA